MTARRYLTGVLFAAGCVAGWWVARRDVAGVAGMLERAGRHPVPPHPADLTDLDDDDAPGVPPVEPPGPWAAAARPAEFVFTGVCDPSDGGCGQVFALRAWSVDVVELDGLCTVVGYCECGRVCAVRHVDVVEAARLLGEGACPVNVLHPAELDETIRVGRRPCWPDADAGRFAADVAGNELDGDLAALLEEYGQ